LPVPSRCAETITQRGVAFQRGMCFGQHIDNMHGGGWHNNPYCSFIVECIDYHVKQKPSA
jgi:hypothetical protein